MQDIDFLPAEYRKRKSNRHGHFRRFGAALALVAVLATVAAFQHRQYRRAEERLAAIEPQYDETAAQSRTLAELQSQWELARADAELLAYLRHPWPRTQVLAAILEPLPEPITIDRIELRREAPRRMNVGPRLSRDEQSAMDEANAKLPPAARDLRVMREEIDPGQTMVTISGTTERMDLIHDYLGQLGQSNLFSKAELDSLETGSDRLPREGAANATVRFTAIVVLRPGYGQPSGPTGSEQLARQEKMNHHP